MAAEHPKVLFVTGEYPPMVGGVGRFTAELAAALQGQGAQVAVLSDEQVPGSTDTGAVRVLPGRRGWGWQILSDIPACARAAGAQWVHIQYQTAAYGMHPAINALPYFLRRQGLRAAWTYHDLRIPYLFPKAGARLRNWVTRLPLRAANAVVVTNQSDWESVQGQVLRGQLHRIPIGNDIKSRRFSAEERIQRRAARGYGSGQLVLGYFGFLNASKGGLTLIETLAALAGEGRDVHLLMIGERVGASDETNFRYLQRVEASISEHGLDSRVQWTGHQSDAEVAADFNTIDVLVMPYEDGMSMRRSTLTAALANGCAIVTTHPQDPTPELRADSDLLLVPPRDPAATAAAVRRIAEDPRLAENLRTNARKVARQFSWEVIAARHLEMYNA
ncbi:MAG: glycosyltransferase family 4 protein [Caldilineaceae bacterium SB0665_bin_25]|nr:glycosyltransferase family 4 protein [Caldilineaceae bacterium SB0665_bin_25]